MSLWVTPRAEDVELARRRLQAQEQLLARITANRQARSRAGRAARRAGREVTDTDVLREFSRTVESWERAVPWLPAGVVLGMSEAGVEPDSAAGRLVAANHLATRGLGETWPAPTTGSRPTTLAPGPELQVDPISAVVTQGRPWSSGVMGAHAERVSDRKVAEEWDSLEPGQVGAARAYLAENTEWSDEEITNLFTFARSNGLSPETVFNQVTRDVLDDNSFGSPADFLRDATKDRPGLWEGAQNRAEGLLSPIVNYYRDTARISEVQRRPAAEAVGTAAGAVDDYYDSNAPIFEHMAGPVNRAVGGALDAVGGYISDTNRALEGGSPQGQTVSAAGVALDEGIGAVTRPAFVALDTGMQAVQANFRNMVSRDLTTSESLLGVAGGQPSYEAQSGVLGQTDAGVSLNLLAAGEDVDLGDGFFPNTYEPDSQVGSIRMANEARHGDVGGHNITIGRWLANRAFEPDTMPFAIASGVVDAAVAVVNPLDVGVDRGYEAYRARRGLSTMGRAAINWNEIVDVADDARYVDVEDIVARVGEGTSFDGIGVHETLERFMVLPDETADAIRRGMDFDAPGVFGPMSREERRRIAAYADEIREMNPDVRVTRPWVHATDADPADPDLLSGGGIRARAAGDTTATGTFSQASLDEAAATRWSAREGMGADDVPDLPGHQLTIDEFTRAVADDAEANIADVTDWHRQVVADAIERGDPVPATVLLDHPDLLPADRLRQLVEVDAGIIRGSFRPDIVTTRFDAFLDTRRGTHLLNNLVGTRDTYDVWRLFDRKVPLDLAAQIADLTDPALIGDLLRRHVGVDIRDLPRRRLRQTDQLTDQLRGAADTSTIRGRARLGAARQLANLPTNTLDIEDLAGSAVSIERWMTNAGMSDEAIRSTIDRVARIEDPAELFDIVTDDLAKGLNTMLRDMGVDRDFANELSRMYADKVLGDRQWAVPDSGVYDIHRTLMPDGTWVETPGPMLASELVNRYVPLPGDPRDIRRQVSALRPIIENPAIGLTHHVAERLTSAWKVPTLLRPAWTVRVVGEEQLRLAASGFDSAFRHPFSYFSMLTDRRMSEGLMGDQLRLMDEHLEAMSRNGGLARGSREAMAENMTKVAGFTTLGRADAGFTSAWGNELVRLWHDPVARQVHNYGVTDETLAWFTRGGGRRHLDAMSGRIDNLDDPEVARRYLNSVADRVAHATRNDPELADLIRTGRLPGQAPAVETTRNGQVTVDGFDSPGKVLEVNDDGTVLVRNVTDDGLAVEATYRIDEVSPLAPDHGLTRTRQGETGLNPALIDYLGRRLDEGIAPHRIVGEDTRFLRSWGDKANEAVNAMFYALGSAPTNKLSRSPLFRQSYWRAVSDMAPYADDAARARILAQAREQRVGRGMLDQISKAFDSSAPGTVNARHIDEIARARAMDDTKSLLFDMTARNQFFDTMRVIFPFGDAWGEVLTRWAKILRQRPLTARRFEQGITTARSEGWFEEGAFGDEVFNYGPLGWATETFLDVPAMIQGRVSGLNIAGEVYPGFGFTVQVPASLVWGDNADRDEIVRFVTGGYQTGDTLTQQVLPSHLRRIFDGFLAEPGAAAPWLPEDVQRGLTSAGAYVGLTNPGRFESTAKDIMDYMVSTGEWPTGTDAEVEALVGEARRRASLFLIGQGVAQSILPTVPLPEWQIETDHGLAMKGVILDEWYEARAADPDGALQQMMDRHGENIWLALQGKTRAVALNPPITRTPLEWVQRNPHVAERFPFTYGLFAPVPTEAEDIDSTAFERVMRTGGREPLTATEMVHMAQNRLAWDIYMRERDQFGDRMTDGEAQYMQATEEWLLGQYPGFQRPLGQTERADSMQLIRELQRAVDDEAIAATPAGQGLAAFLDGWDQAVAAGREFSSADIPFARSAETAHIRAYVRDLGEWTVGEYPEFEPIWRQVFERALADPDEEN